ncbi:MAG: phosphate uptake regulator PhoU [Desulfurococcales archaeon]|nr:phosphate uptake regulator PhoU [Desulfurococcales archaeon]
MEGEYYRRVQLVGGSTYVVALPKEWAVSHGITRGSRVRLVVLPSGQLLVEPAPSQPGGRGGRAGARVEYRPGDYSGSLRRVVSHYVAGAEVVEIHYPPEAAGEAERLVGQLRNILLGVEVLEAEPGLYRLYAVLDDYSVGFWDAYSKMRRAVVGMMESLEAAVEAGDSGMAGEVAGRDDIVDRLYLYLVRQLTKSLLHGTAYATIGLTAAEAPHVFLAIKSLERIGDHTTILSSIASRGAHKLKPLLPQMRGLRGLVSHATRLLQNPNLEEANTRANEASRLARELRRARDTHAHNPPLSHAALSLARIANYAQDILEASIDIQTIRRSSNHATPNP